MTQARSERRRANRRRARVKVRYWNNEVDRVGHSGDMSNTGLFLETRFPLDVGTRLHLEFYLSDQSFFAEAIVTRSLRPHGSARRQRVGMGLRLLGLAEGIRLLGSTTATPEPILRIFLSSPDHLRCLLDAQIRRGGLFVPTDVPPAQHAQVIVQLNLPEPHGLFEVRGVVTHVAQDPAGADVQLDDPDQVRGYLQRLLKRNG